MEMVVDHKLPHRAEEVNQYVIDCLLSGAADWSWRKGGEIYQWSEASVSSEVQCAIFGLIYDF